MAAAKDRKSVRKARTAHPPAKPADGLVDALAEAAWSEADQALAEALSHFDELEHAATARRRELIDLLGQALSRAARRRGLARFGAAGAVEKFDPQRHEVCAGRTLRPMKVVVVSRGVARGGEVLAKARVRPSA